MKLYYSPGACSLSPNIVAHEAGIALDLVKVDLAVKKTETGDDFYAVTAKGYVPALALDNGDVITEGVAILLYLSALKPDAKLMPQVDSPEFIKFFEQLLFITTELHKGLGGLFAPLPEEAKEIIRTRLKTRLTYIAGELADKPYLFGEHFTAADAYLFTVLNWAPKVKVDIAAWPVLTEFQARVGSRPAVIAAMTEEGLPTAKAA